MVIEFQSKPDDREYVLEAISNLGEPVRIKDIALSLRRTDTYVRRAVNDLVAQGIVYKMGEHKQSRYWIHEHIRNGIDKVQTSLPSLIRE